MTLSVEAPHSTPPSLVKFGGNRSCGSRDIADLIFHMSLHISLVLHVTKGHCDFMERGFSLYIPTLTCLVALNIVVVDI